MAEGLGGMEVSGARKEAANRGARPTDPIQIPPISRLTRATVKVNIRSAHLAVQ